MGEFEVHCWMRCMAYNTTSVASSEECEDKGEEAVCMDNENHLWINGLHDSSYTIQCANVTDLDLATLRPTTSPTISAMPTISPAPTITASPTVQGTFIIENSGEEVITDGKNLDSGASPSTTTIITGAWAVLGLVVTLVVSTFVVHI